VQGPHKPGDRGRDREIRTSTITNSREAIERTLRSFDSAQGRLSPEQPAYESFPSSLLSN